MSISDYNGEGDDSQSNRNDSLPIYGDGDDAKEYAGKKVQEETKEEIDLGPSMLSGLGIDVDNPYKDIGKIKMTNTNIIIITVFSSLITI